MVTSMRWRFVREAQNLRRPGSHGETGVPMVSRSSWPFVLLRSASSAPPRSLRSPLHCHRNGDFCMWLSDPLGGFPRWPSNPYSEENIACPPTGTSTDPAGRFYLRVSVIFAFIWRNARRTSPRPGWRPHPVCIRLGSWVKPAHFEKYLRISTISYRKIVSSYS